MQKKLSPFLFLLLALPIQAAEPVSYFPRTLQLLVSPKAEALLQKTGETIVITAQYYGQPAEKAARTAPVAALLDEMGQIPLGSEQIELKKERSATLTGQSLDAGRLKFVESDGPRLMLNVFSGRRRVKNNLLYCEPFDERLKKAAGELIGISCKLIGE